MRKLRTALCILLLLLMIPAVATLKGRLPMNTQPLIEKKYGGWAGVLRLWVFEGWTPGTGSAAGWLNRCVSAFEKAHPGVYIQPEYVDASAVRDFAEDGILPPDLLLFPPGILEDADGLVPIDVNGLRPALAGLGVVDGSRFATPVLLGGYLWAYNPEKLEGIPGSWREAELMPSVAEDEPHRQWGAALLSLCAHWQSASAAPVSDGLMDLGLPPAQSQPTATPPVAKPGSPCQLPEGFRRQSDAWKRFMNGDTSAVLVTQREVRRMEMLDEQGKGVDWRLAGGASAMFTDQVLYLAIPAREQDDGRLSLCQAFAAHLLSDACQETLSRAGAFAVTDAPSGYAAGEALSIMDGALRACDLAAAPAFGDGWQEDVHAIVRKFIEESGDPAALWGRAKAILREKDEH